MAKMKSDKYFITKLKPGMEMPTKDATRFLWLDDEVIKGAFYMECIWFWPKQKWTMPGVEEHTHDFDEIIAFFGSNPEDPYDLGGEIELWVDGEKHVMTRSFLAFVPAGVKHCPLKMIKVNKPMFHITTGPGTTYTRLHNKKNK